MWKMTQRSWAAGRLDAELMGRQDLAKYFQGASELVNFSVRKQGLVSKRRGTDLVFGAESAWGTKEDGTAYAATAMRMFPLTERKDSGHVVVFAEREDGVRSAFLATLSGTGGAALSAPVAIPYAGMDFADISYHQSGDTLFLAHRDYPPARIVNTDGEIEYRKIDFSAEKWSPPVITSAVKTGVDGESTAGTVTVYYVATYLKDGVESVPSAPVAVNYRAPWRQGGTVKITCAKGLNAEEPDQYLVYKKTTGGGYGLIQSSDSSASATWPSGTQLDTSWADISSDIADGIFMRHSDVLSFADPADFSWGGGIGGSADVPSKVAATVPEDSGFHANVVKARLDIVSRQVRHVGGGTGETDAVHYYCKGPVVRAGITLRRWKGDEMTTATLRSIAVTMAEIESCASQAQPHVHSNAFPYVNATWKQAYANIGGAPRSVSFDMKYEVAEATDGYDRWEVTEVSVQCFAADGETPADIYLCGLAVGIFETDGNVCIDDYVTPDLTVTPPSSGPHFATAGDYPGCVGMHQQRLVFASTRNEPFRFWMSCIGDLYNFNVHDSIREDDAISAEIAATEFPEINHIVSGRDLMLFADNGEWVVAPSSGSSLTYKTVSAKLQSAIGCSKTVKPMLVGDEIVFANRTGETLYATRYSFGSDGYESSDLTVLSSWIFKGNPVVQMAYRKNPDSSIECVLSDGTVANLVYMKEHEVVAWSRHIPSAALDGFAYVGVASTGGERNGTTEMAYLALWGGSFRLLRGRDEIPVRSGSLPAEDFLCADCVHAIAEGEAVPEGMRTVAAADGRTLAYVPFAAELETVRPEPQGAAGTIQFEVRNAKAAEVRVIDSGSFTVRAVGVPEALAVASGTSAAVAGGKVSLCSGDVRKVLAGRNGTDGRVVVRSEDEWPLNLLSLSVDYEIEPLSGSKG